MRTRLSLAILILLSALSAAAQSVRWQASTDSVAIGQITNLVLLFNNCEVEGELSLPVIPNLEVGQPQRGEQSSTRIINGQRSDERLVYYAFPVRALDEGPVHIPAFTVPTTAGQQTVPALTLSVREATLGDTNIRIADITTSALRVGTPGRDLWAGEVVPVDYELSVSARFQANLASEPTWEPAPLIVEAWGEPTAGKEGSGRDVRNIITYSARGYFPQPGTFTLGSVQQVVNIGIPTTSFFPSLRAEQFAITSDAPQVVVKPLPPGAPASFAGAVGSFTLSSRVVPGEATVSEPITWTLSLQGTGNWPAISALPAREASNAFRIVQPQANRTNPEGKLFDGTISEDVVLIPTTAGTYTLPPVEWTYFDPATGAYRTLRTEAHEVTIAPAAAAGSRPGSSLNAPPAVDGPTPLDANAPIRSTPAPASPSALPLEPLPGSATAARPLSTRALVITGIVTAALLPLFWLLLAFRHARAADPGRHARAAKRQLSTAIQRVASAPDEPTRTAALLTWQRLAATLWMSPRAVPSAAIFAGDETWAQLWRDAERALYARGGPLPADWIERARTAAARQRAPRFPLLRCFALRHLFPALALLASAAALYPLSTYAATAPDAVAAYQSGDFAAAEARWRSAADENPTDWIAHHNLALALAQQGRFDEAGAHAAVAFVQNPHDPSTRWHLSYTLDRSGYTPPIIGRFLHPTWRQKVAWLASPAQWQHALIGAMATFALSLALLLAASYFPRSRALRPFAWLFMLVALLTASAAGLGLHTWGLTTQTDAVLTWRATPLRSIPTDLADEQESTPLAAGSLARVTKRFLGWRQLAFPNGQTGWVRQEELVPLWQSGK